MKAIMKFLNNIIGVKTYVFKEKGRWMVRDDFVILGVVVGTDTRTATEAAVTV